MATNLYDYYTQNGGTFNTWDSAQRQADATKAGISNYTGTVAQNTQLLNYLQSAQPASTPQTPIYTNQLAQTQPYQFQNPIPPPPPPVSTLEAFSLTPQETEIQNALKAISSGNDALVGRTAYQNEQEQAAGLPGLLDTQNSLSKQLLALQAEDKNLEDQMQHQAEGRGITAAGLEPHTFDARRELSIKANILSAQLAAAQLDVASARDRVTKAVELKFGPLEEQQKARISNLELLLKDPALDLADKKRALSQLTLQKQQEQTLATQKADYEAIQEIAIQAAALKADAVTLQRIASAKSAIEATQIAAAAGLLPQGDQYTLSPGQTRYDEQGNVVASVPKTTTTTDGGGGGGTTTPTYSKGRLSNSQWVELSLQRKGLTYDQALKMVPQGKVGVVVNATGEIGFIDPIEFDTKTYTYL